MWNIFSYFSQITEFDISCKLPPFETVCMNYLILFSAEKNQNILSVENFTQSAKG